MSDKTTTNDYTETIRRARERMGQYTPGKWVLLRSGLWTKSDEYDEIVLHVNTNEELVCSNSADRGLINDAPDLNAALVALADERDALRAERQRVINLLNDELRGIDTNRYPDSALDVFFARGMKFAFRSALGMLGDVPSKDDQP